MKINHIYCAILSLLIVGVAWCFLGRYIEDYTLKATQQQYGTLSLSAEHEAKIRQIAEEMKVYEPFIIRKMNRQSLLAFGYCNAFAYFPQFLGYIPIGNSFLFISEGFFHELSLEEQRFLIGHELAHIQEQHTRYLNILLAIVTILLSIGMWLFIRTKINPYICQKVAERYHALSKALSTFFLFYIILVIPNLCGLAYRRHIEWIADKKSLSLLNSYDGAIKLMDRWQKDFNLPLHNPCYGLLADHPSFYERKVYCLNLKNKAENLS